MYRVFVWIFIVFFISGYLSSQTTVAKQDSKPNTTKSATKSKSTKAKTNNQDAIKSTEQSKINKSNIEPSQQVESTILTQFNSPANEIQENNKLSSVTEVKQTSAVPIHLVQNVPVEPMPISESKRKKIIEEAEKYLGKPYRSKVGNMIFDCSGYVKFLMSKIEKNVTRSSVSQIHDGKRVTNIKDAKPGDILVFKGRSVRNNRPGHVGILHHWSNDTLYFIHSSTSRGIRIDHLFDPYYAKRFLQIRNVIGDD